MTTLAHRRSAPTSPVEETEVRPLKCTGATVRRLSRRITSFYEQRLDGLRLGQYSLLAHLSEEPQALRRLSHRLEMDRTTLTRTLKPLLANGWVKEVPGADARQRLLVLTPAGKRLRTRAHAAWKAAQLALEKELGRDLVAGLHAQLDAALARLKAVLPDEN